MKTIKVKDERILQESNRIFKYCFYVLCAGIFLDLCVKINLWNFSINNNGKGVNDFPFIITIGFEAIFLIAAFLTNIFLLARKGITFGNKDFSDSKFPVNYYFKMAIWFSLIISLAFFILRTVIYLIDGIESSPNIIAEFLALGFVVLICFLISFIFAFLSFFITYKKAIKVMTKQNLN